MPGIFVSDDFQSPQVGSSGLPLLYTKEIDSEIVLQDRVTKLTKLEQLPSSSSVDEILSFAMTEVLDQFETDRTSQLHWLPVEIEDPDEPRENGIFLSFDVFAMIDLLQQDVDLVQRLNETYSELFPMVYTYTRK